MNPRVRAVTPLPGNRLHLVFTNGEQGIYDVLDSKEVGPSCPSRATA
jgi:hypothetical protein